ncbi:MAG: cation transporter [Anaerolineaceae bacterium]|nr:cation transporter [Anaerolineaceae bacterium]MBN2676634.1 cation transporter [Anaerolineaceae bacterium]
MPVHDSLNIEKRFILSFIVTALILAGEVAGGIFTGSLALLSDAAHVLMDILALVLSYAALRLASFPPDDRHTFGFHRLEVLAALVNGISLGGIAVGIFIEAWRRWQTPAPIKNLEMLVIAAIGLALNLVVVFILRGGMHAHHGQQHDAQHQAEDLNVKSAFLHVLGDAAASVGVILAALIMMQTGWIWIDPLMSVLIGLLILVSAWRVLRSSLHILVEGVPEGITLPQVAEAITSTPGVANIHDLHVWNICSLNVALAVHVVLECDSLKNRVGVMHELKARLSSMGIEHTTIQFELEHCNQPECASEHAS